MTAIGFPPRTPGDWDRPAAQVAADMKALVARQRKQHLAEGAAAEARHLGDPTDHAWEHLAVDHPEACSTDADYPGWKPGRAR